jgi:S-adenosylmethionine synthetase
MKVITSEMVFKGHPDKICDEISDSILDAYLAQDKKSRVAVETLIKDDMVVIAGEVTSKAIVNVKEIAEDVLIKLGYKDLDKYRFVVRISMQSPDIALGVDKDGAGDQGIMYGYAADETFELMPLPIVLARRIAIKMDELTKHIPQFFGSDGKCQVSVEYNGNDEPVRASTIVVSQQTTKEATREFYESFIINECIKKVVPPEFIDENTKILINPTGEFIKGGPYADCGLTGRKIICDTYGGVGRHGGGAFSGKDATKVDRSAAYYARYVAKNIVASGVAKKCEVQVAYAIGVSTPVAINIDAFGTSKYSNDEIKDVVLKFFNFSPSAIRNEIITDDICYYDLAKYGHIGRTDIVVPWERTNKAYVLKKYFKDYKK